VRSLYTRYGFSMPVVFRIGPEEPLTGTISLIWCTATSASPVIG
jgi:hypothetical protein